jgi:nicotinamide-nucleotide amidase
MEFSSEHLSKASRALEVAKAAGVRIATVETCTAGLVSACLTSVPGASDVFERGFVLYHMSAKATGVGVPDEISKKYGVVSAEVTKGLAEGGLSNSTAGVCVAVTGYAGPGGGNDRDPVGTCYFAAASKGKATKERRVVLPGSRNEVRLGAVREALELVVTQLEDD